MSDITETPTNTSIDQTATPAAGTPTEPASSAPAQQAAPDTSWVPKRISEITNARRAAEQRATEEAQRAAAAEAENARLREQLVAFGGTPPQPGATPAAPASGQNVDQLARAYAERMVREQTEHANLQSRINAINEAGTKEFGEDFDKSVQNLGMAGVGGPEFLRVLAAIPKAEAVVTWLGKSENLTEAARIASLDPVQMGIELTKMSGKAAKDLGKQVSRAPTPIEPVSGSGGGTDGAPPDPSDTKAWMAWRNKSARRK